MDEKTIDRLEQMMEETLELAEENNRVLTGIQRTLRWSFWGKIVLWAVVLILPFFVLGPLINSILPVSYSEGNAKNLFGLPSADQLQSLIKAYRPEAAATTTP